MMGEDVEYPTEMEDDELLLLCQRTGRILLTRDRSLADRLGRLGHYIGAHDLPEQIKEFMSAFGASGDRFDRCTLCNGELVGAEQLALRDHIPEGVLFRYSSFWICVRCRKIYWHGDKWAAISRMLDALYSLWVDRTKELYHGEETHG